MVSNLEPDPVEPSAPQPSVVDAINQMFAEFELVYHNQFNKAYSNPEKLMYAKKLWYSHLRDYTPEQILKAVNTAVRESEFLPTVRGILKYLQTKPEDLGLPSVRDAYIEACRAPSPKAAFGWSHPAVYHAGRASDWFFLASTPESKALPVYRHNYELLCQRVLDGEDLDVELPKALPAETNTPLSNQERKSRLQRLRQDTGI